MASTKYHQDSPSTHGEEVMKKIMARVALSGAVGIVASLGVATPAVVASVALVPEKASISTAGAVGAAAVTTATANARCGLSGSYNGDRYYYTIRNCHGYTVKRKVEVEKGYDGDCETIPAYSSIRNFVFLGIFSKVKGLKRCG
jgi:hypothetical protein